MKELHTIILKAEDRSHGIKAKVWRRVVREDEHGKYALIDGMKAYLVAREGNGFYVDYFMNKEGSK